MPNINILRKITHTHVLIFTRKNFHKRHLNINKKHEHFNFLFSLFYEDMSFRYVIYAKINRTEKRISNECLKEFTFKSNWEENTQCNLRLQYANLFKNKLRTLFYQYFLAKMKHIFENHFGNPPSRNKKSHSQLQPRNVIS